MPGLPINKNSEYQVLARRYRPQSFQEVLGQNAIVTTLKNAIKQNRLAHAYLFSGPRGTGKTTLARLLSKAINCVNPTADFDPCNECASCREITSGTSLDVIEIDGASNRGIDDIRQINETVGYSSSFGKYKIYIIDEVHMLTKEAFNALLKTLEEPPLTVKFFFATTEPHKVPPTVLSRCQQFQLKHLPTTLIANKLQRIVKDLSREVDEEALMMIARRAEGGLRDAESLLDQQLSFYDGPITALHASDVLGTLPQEAFFKLDLAGKEGNLAHVFELSAQIFNEGKDPIRFVETLIEHFRNLLFIKIAGINSPSLEISNELKNSYNQSAGIYQRNQLQSVLELCLDASSHLRFAASPRIALESLLLKILRSHTKISIDELVERLMDLERRISKPGMLEATPQKISPIEPPKELPKETSKPIPKPEGKKEVFTPINEDPTPNPKELPRKAIPKQKEETPRPVQSAASTPRAETILQFAAVELEGKIIKK